MNSRLEEFIIDYGWAFLIIIIVAAALFSLFIYNPEILIEQCHDEGGEALISPFGIYKGCLK